MSMCHFGGEFQDIMTDERPVHSIGEQTKKFITSTVGNVQLLSQGESLAPHRRHYVEPSQIFIFGPEVEGHLSGR